VNRWPRPHLLEVVYDRIANRCEERIALHIAPLAPRDMQKIVFLIQMLQTQRRDFAHAQTVNRHEH